MHKTGTTAIQNWAASSNDLVKNGIVYPVGLFSNFRNQHSELAFMVERGDLQGVDRLFQHLERRVNEQSGTALFLSGEELSSLSPSAVKDLVSIAKQYFEPILPVVAFRDKEEFLKAQYNQHLKSAQYIVSEHGFRQRMQVSPKKVVKAWTLPDLLLEVKTLDYGKIKNALVAEFAREVFGISFNDITYKHFNRSMDFVCASFINTLFKEQNVVTLTQLNKLYQKSFSEKLPSLAIEDVIVDSLAKMYPDDEWFAQIGFPGTAQARPAFEEDERSLEKDTVVHYIDRIVAFASLIKAELNKENKAAIVRYSARVVDAQLVGWAYKLSDPSLTLQVQVVDTQTGDAIACVKADQFRADMVNKHPTGRCGFIVDLVEFSNRGPRMLAFQIDGSEYERFAFGSY